MKPPISRKIESDLLNKLASLRKNVFWRIAYGKEMPSQADLDEAVTRQLKTALRREPTPDDM